ncbi:unnamed protein product [Malus baccata var. baccata]
MNDQSQLMNQAPPMMSLSQAQVMSQPPPQMMSQPLQQMMAPSSQSLAVQQQQQQQQQSQLMMMKSQSQPMMMNRNYKAWPQPQPQFAAQKPPPSNVGRNNWKGKKGGDKRRTDKNVPNLPLSGQTSGGGGGGGGGGYIPPTLHELQSQNRMKARKFYPKKKFNNRFAPYAPRNTTSYIIRAKKAGGIASLVSPYPVTPAVLPTPMFSPSREVLGDMAKEEWGVDGYGSMKGLIRLRSPGNDDDEGGGGSSESDVEEHVEVERRLDHDLSRFEMVYPNYSGVEYNNALENRVDDQDTHIAQLEEENLTLKERLFLMERELADLRRRMQFIERRCHVMGEVNEEVVENAFENDSDGGSDAPHMGMEGENNPEMVDYVSRDGGSRSVGALAENESVRDVDVGMEEYVPNEMILKENEVKDETRNEFVGSEEIEEFKSELTPEKVTGNKNEAEDKMVKDEVEIKNETELMQGEMNAKKDEEMGIACLEKSIGDGD